jgi:putative SOS response-associated peptidase YedK
MCSNFQPITTEQTPWVNQHFGCDLPNAPWRAETYPTYPAPFIYLEDGKPRCELAQFGLVPHWAADKKKFGLHTYNARSETVAEKPSYRSAWKERRFGLAIMQSCKFQCKNAPDLLRLCQAGYYLV